MFKKLALLTAALFVLFVSASAQNKISNSDIKKYKKAVEEYDNGNLSNAENLIDELLEENSYVQEFLELKMKVAVGIYRYWLKNNKPVDVSNIKIKGKTAAESDSLTLAARAEYKDKSMSDISRMDLVNFLRRATLNNPNIEYASVYLRNFKVDFRPDSAVKGDAKEAFDVAEEEFGKGNYTLAIQSFKKARELQPNYYAATLYLGDSYYEKEDYENAIKYFKEAHEMQPKLLEAAKFLFDGYRKAKKKDEALDALKEALLIYPSNDMMLKAEKFVTEDLGKKFDRKWEFRGIYPNEMDDSPRSAKLPALQAYIDALAKIRPFCDSIGKVIKPNGLTKAKYAEEYAWEELLRIAPNDLFPQARLMQKKGWLDCYAFVSNFHNDLYKQYASFAAENEARIFEYIDTVLIE